MKKSKMMRLASCLLVLTLLTTCMISGTFAKYVTAGSGEDIARVAKFGVKVDGNGDMFLKGYAKDDSTYTVSSNTVASSDTWNVVAPGTTGSLTEVALTGTPEVATRVTYDATITLDGWTLTGGAEYCPLYFTVEGKTYGTNATGLGFDYTYGTVAELKAGVEAAIEACAKDYAPNTDLSATGVDANAPSVTWNWPFETGHDVEDTDLGDKAAAGNYAVVKVEVKTTVTQID